MYHKKNALEVLKLENAKDWISHYEKYQHVLKEIRLVHM